MEDSSRKIDMSNHTTLRGRVTCTLYYELSKRTRQKCKAPAVSGKNKCRLHVGRSTGPKTESRGFSGELKGRGVTF